jgi:hypothetical protein
VGATTNKKANRVTVYNNMNPKYSDKRIKKEWWNRGSFASYLG